MTCLSSRELKRIGEGGRIFKLIFTGCLATITEDLETFNTKLAQYSMENIKTNMELYHGFKTN